MRWRPTSAAARIDEVPSNVNAITWGYTEIADAGLLTPPYDTAASLIADDLAYPTRWGCRNDRAAGPVCRKS